MIASGRRWYAQIYYDSKDHYISCFDTKQEAALAYDTAARQCGEDKPLNYESIAAATQVAMPQEEVLPSPPPTQAQSPARFLLGGVRPQGSGGDPRTHALPRPPLHPAQPHVAVEGQLWPTETTDLKSVNASSNSETSTHHDLIGTNMGH
jgi:hypothetical protein